MSNKVYQHCMHNNFDMHIDRHPKLPESIKRRIEWEQKSDFARQNIEEQIFTSLRAELLTKNVKQDQVLSEAGLVNYAVYETAIKDRNSKLKALYKADYAQWKKDLALKGYDFVLTENWKNESEVRHIQ
ncbi:hypothetical protein SS50377_26723 [Spironucleus salmonicida]|uniref:Uncharacterized protein n=1 Tax=Spironucleus salmonicida TaxID=348837 RepID=V6M706_9EUKA|nr:hypothetical protein SS50377_26723 [Spironucleus salmonicida]|eukprot:EST49194.1 hypothetical protein SS50377_10410 [Spironucleus salmonicida]